ncbi:MAG: response regulator, partial [Oceanococcaceae bacterium]
MNTLKTVLLVDDYEADNFIHRLALERLGCVEQVIGCNDGREALDCLHDRDRVGQPLPELIFLDINMPVMNGWEFLEEFEARYSAYSGGTVVVMLSTSLNPDDQARATRYSKVRSFIDKPLTKARLRELLGRLFPE